MATPIALVEHPAEHVLFDGALTCDVVLPAHFDTGARVVMQATSEALLKGLAIAEDVRGDDPDERKEATPTQQRIEANLHNDASALRESLDLLGEIESAWNAIPPEQRHVPAMAAAR